MIRFLTLREAHQNYGVPIATLKTWIYRKKLEARGLDYDTPGRHGFRYVVRSDKLEPLIATWRSHNVDKRFQQALRELPKDEIYFTPVEIARIFKIAKRSVLAWIRSGKLKAIYLGSYHNIRVSKKSLGKFLRDSNGQRSVA